MQITPYKLRKIVPPKDDLKTAMRESKLTLKEGDIIAISSKVVSIGEGATVPLESIDKEELMKREADWYYKAGKNSRYRRYFTIARGAMVGGAGIDESNANGHYVLYPKDPFKSAKQLRTWLQKEYNVQNITVLITDSNSLIMRRGAIGFALAWDALDPLRDYRGTKDLFGREIRVEMANLADALAAAAVLAMGEGDEQTPIAVIRGAKNISRKNRTPRQEKFILPPDDDVFAPLVWRAGWKKGGAGK